MLNADAIRASFERLIAGNASDDDLQAAQQAWLAGDVVFATGESSAAIGGDVAGTILITGDNAQVNLSLNEAAYEQLKDRLFPAPKGIPPPFSGQVFLGREEALLDIKRLLGIGEASHQSRIIIVRGWPGVGKTTLSSVLSRDSDIAKTFPDGTLWASPGQQPSLLSILAEWGRALDTADLLRVRSEEDAIERIRAALQHRRMLLIVDDVWEIARGALFIKALNNSCALVMTTRLPEVADGLVESAEAIYNLPVLSENDSLKLVRILAPSVVAQHEDECLQLARDLEYLPLALQVAGRLLRVEDRHGWGVSDLLREIREGASLMQSTAPADLAKNQSIPTVTTLLRKSTDLLDHQAQDCFALLGVFAPKPATFDLEAMKSMWQTQDPRPIVRKLVSRGLLEPAGGGRFQMHALLVMHARSLLE